jgi:dipeptidyl aminopeptidase/acylaminoacyl peptidase
MVLYVHGGPWARDQYGYNSAHQWLANRGYAVLSVNYRGSTGFGKDFINSAVGQWSGAMHEDLIDSVDWAVAQGVTRRNSVAIMGGSYGGYATLVGLTFTPDRFRCGVDIVGPSNLVTLMESFPAYWRPILAGTFYRHIGDPATPEGRARAMAQSPITRVDRIRVPLLIGQGQNDPRVVKAESDQIAAAMRQRGPPVTYVNFPDEGHGFARPPNSMSFFAITEAFLQPCLGGRFQPIGDDFTGSSLQVLEGVEHVPGLRDALARRASQAGQ